MTSIPQPLPKSSAIIIVQPMNSSFIEQSLDEAMTSIYNNSIWYFINQRQHKSVLERDMCYKHVRPVLQVGPTCGLVALSMASQLTEKVWNVEDLFEISISYGFTRQGEMFSVRNMQRLASIVLSSKYNAEVKTFDNNTHKNFLNKNKLFIVPYDADKDHSPGCNKGHGAHWALICGVIKTPLDEILVLARQGKSKSVKVWSYENLRKSNCQLFEISPKRLDGNYVLADLRNEMAGKYVELEEKDM